MRILGSTEYINEKMNIQPVTKERLAGLKHIYRYFPKNRKELIDIIEKRRMEDPNCDLNDIDVSAITDMTGLFKNTSFNGNISMWDVSNVTTMVSMFSNSAFNGDISNWNVSNVTDMTEMFYESDFNGDISKWNVSNLIDMSFMFTDSAFDGNLSSWDVSNVDLHQNCFDGTALEKDQKKQPKFNEII